MVEHLTISGRSQEEMKAQDDVLAYKEKTYQEFVRVFEQHMGFGQIISFQSNVEEEKKGDRFDSQEFNLTKKIKHPYDEDKLIKFIQESRKILNQNYLVVTLGPTKAGKSTFLRKLTNMKTCFLSGIEKETSYFWNFLEGTNLQKSIIFAEVHLENKKKVEAFDSIQQLGEKIKHYQRNQNKSYSSTENAKIKEINVLIDKSITRQQFSIISGLIQLVDIPGVDDENKVEEIFPFIKDNLEFMIPIIVCPLFGDPKATVQFYKAVELLEGNRYITVVFTQLDQLINSTRKQALQDDEDISASQLKVVALKDAEQFINNTFQYFLKRTKNAKFYFFNLPFVEEIFHQIIDNKVFLSYTPQKDFQELTNINSIQEVIESTCKNELPKIYQNKIFPRLYKHYQTFFNDVEAKQFGDAIQSLLSKSKSKITAFQDNCQATARPIIRAYLSDALIPKIKKIFNVIRENKKDNKFLDENYLKQKIFDEIFELIEVEMKQLEDRLKETIVQVQRQTLENQLKQIISDASIEQNKSTLKAKEVIVKDKAKQSSGKFFFNPTRWIWNFEESLDLIEKTYVVKTLESDEYADSIINSFHNHVKEIGKEYTDKITHLLIAGSENDQSNRYAAIEKYFPGCKPAEAKKVLDLWKTDVSKFKEPKK